MSKDKVGELKNTESEKEETELEVVLVNVLSSSKGMISQIFNDMEPTMVLRLLSAMGEDDARSYLKKEKKRIATYITTKNPALKFKKIMDSPRACFNLLAFWFVSNIAKEGFIPRRNLQSEDFHYNFVENFDINVNLAEKLFLRDDLLRSYIAIGCILCTGNVRSQFSNDELNRFVQLFPDISKDVLNEYLDKIKKRVPEGTDAFLARILNHEEKYETLAMKFEGAAKVLRNLNVPQESLADEVNQLTEEFEALKRAFQEKWIDKEGYVLGENETLDTTQDMKDILSKIEEQRNAQDQTVSKNIERAQQQLKKARSICIKGKNKDEQLLATFREKVDFLSDQIKEDLTQVDAILGGNHPIAKMLELVGNNKKPDVDDVALLLRDLQKFCGSEECNNIVFNLINGNIILEDKISMDEEDVQKEDETYPITAQNADQTDIITPEEPSGIEEKEEIEKIEQQAATEKQPPTKPEPEVAVNEEVVTEQDETTTDQAKNKANEPEAKPQKQETSIAIGSVIPIYVYAKKVSESLKKNALENLIWALIYEDDLPGAYWLARATEAKYDECIVSPWMLIAIQGARWITSESIAYVDNLLEIAKTNRPGNRNTETILGLAASLRSAIIQPGSGLIDWLQKPEKASPELINLIESVKEFSKYGKAIMPEEVKGVVGSTNLNERITEIAGAANRWLKEASTKRAKFKMATEVWRQLTSSRGEIHELLKPVIDNNKNSIDIVKSNLSNWQRPDFVESKIDEITKKNSRLQVRKIVGSPRQHIIRNIEEACEHAYKWCQLINLEHEYGKKGNKLSEQIKTLQKNIKGCIPELHNLFLELTGNSGPAHMTASYACLARTINQLLKDLNIDAEGGALPPGRETDWSWLMKKTRSLDEAIRRRLFMIPEYSFTPETDLTKEQNEEFIKIFCESIAANRSLEDIYRIWIKKQDYRYLDKLSLAFSEQQIAELQIIYDGSLKESEQKLKEALADTSNYVEQALVDGIITDAIYSEYNNQIQAIEMSTNLNFKSKNDILKEIKNKIIEERESRLIELNKDWEQLNKKMEGLSEPSSKKKQVKEFIQNALDKKDTRVIEESLSHIREVFDKGTNLEENLFNTKTNTYDLDEYVRTVPKIKEGLEGSSRHKGLMTASEAIENGITWAGISFGHLQTPRRDESVKALDLWRNLKKQKPTASKINDDIAGVLRFMGFSLDFKSGMPPVQVQKTGQDWAYCTANMSAGNLSKPIPQFGSLTRNRYEIICLWERPGADTIAARLRELRLDVGNAIVFFLGRLYDRQRRDLVRISRNRTVSAALLDETLLLFLTKENDASNRLPVFFRCSLPYTALNPYMPFQAGDVPPEMFFGRWEMIRELQKMGGSCIVYGGRQLGKSALLRRVQREFHNPERDQYSAVLDIKLLGDPKAMLRTDLIWGRIRESFKSMGLLARNITTERPEEIRKYINDVLGQDVKRKIILLFDEADNFLEADAKDNFKEVEALRTMMLDNDYRFKVVFAGLQNVQRFQGIPNQPLAHFGTNICVGPLEPDAAMRLVIEPIEAIGYRFKEEKTAVLRILSYTNYHPGLIQLFCQELIKQLESSTGSTSPPFPVRQEDVEAVYRLDEVRSRIKERFDWTLALNSRYQAIAWIMVLEQIEQRDSYALAYPPGNILNLAKYWWPEGFADVSLDELRGLLNEMCGLGVLVRNHDGHYRLRSPNLARLLGTEDDILNNLEELKAPLPFNADNYHVPLDDTAHSYSPLTYYQERNLNKQNSGTGLIFSSEAQGLTHLTSALKKFIPTDSGNSSGLFLEIPADVTSSATFSFWLEKHVESNKKYENIVACKHVYDSDIKDVVDYVNLTMQFCRRSQSRKRWIRIFFVFDPIVTWQWITLPEKIRKDIEDKADASINTRKWNYEGLQQRFAQHDKMDQRNRLEQTLDVTGGWPLLLDILFDRCGSHDDVKPFLMEMQDELKDASSILRKNFLNALGVMNNGVTESILTYLKSFGGDELVPVDLIHPDYIKSDNRLTINDCRDGIEYLSRMSCIDVQNESVRMDPIVKAVLP